MSSSFQKLGLDPLLLKGVLSMGYSQPTPVQRKVLPVAMSGKDVVCMARTGSGKTAAFLIPMLETLARDEEGMGVVISPTRELALQTFRFSRKMAKFLVGMRQAAVVGGESMERQFEELGSAQRALIATPGRLAHLLREMPDLSVAETRVCVFDEADRLFEMGFADEIGELLKAMKSRRQTMLFSATMPKLLAQFARCLKDDAEVVRLEEESSLSESLRVAFFTTRSDLVEKLAVLVAVLRALVDPAELCLIFVSTRHHCDLVANALDRCLSPRRVAAIYGSMDQEARSAHLKAFRTGQAPLLVVTDVAARGIDVPLVDHVLNFSFPPSPRLFVHRAGRAARQGRPGICMNLVEPDELDYINELPLHDKNLEQQQTVVGDEAEKKRNAAYTKATWTTNQVHVGNLPEDLYLIDLDLLARLAKDDVDFKAQLKTANNGTKAYKRTRRAPRTSKKKKTPSCLVADGHHPLFRGQDDDQRQSSSSMKKQLAAWRPKQTIFEVNPQLVQDTLAVKALDKFRVKLARQKEQRQSDQPNDGDASRGGGGEEEEDDDDAAVAIPEGGENVAAFRSSKKRISKAERRRLKAGKTVLHEGGVAAAASSSASSSSYKQHYISYGVAEDSTSERESRSRGAEAKSQELLEAAMLDVTPDEAVEMAKKKRMYKWDARKKKYVQRTVGDLAENSSLAKGRRIKNEAGKLVGDQSTAGALYQKWQAKKKKKSGKDEELLDSTQIAKKRKRAQDLKLKNMPKEKRRAMTSAAKLKGR